MHHARPSPRVAMPRAPGRLALALLLLAVPAAAQQRVNHANWMLEERFSSDALRALVNT